MQNWDKDVGTKILIVQSWEKDVRDKIITV